MKKLLAGLMITSLLLPGPVAATYSGFGTNEPFDSTGGSKVTSEVIQSGTVAKTAPAKKKTKKKTKKKKSTKAHKKKKAKKAKKHTKKAKVHKPHAAKEHIIKSQGEALPPVQVPSTEH